MTNEIISKAVLIALNTGTHGASYDSVYGGETLLNRTLIAASKSGIQFVRIICPEDHRSRIVAQIDSLHKKRLALEYEILELRSGEWLSDKIALAVENWEDLFLLFETDKIVHPTFLNQAVKLNVPQKPLLVCYKNVWQESGVLFFDPAFTDKFRIIFKIGKAFTKVRLPAGVFRNPVLETAGGLEISPDAHSGIYSTDVAVCRKSDVHVPFNSFSEMIKQWNDNRVLALAFIENAFWLKLSGKESAGEIKEFFWKIAFKEISGEFSKLVNSRLSKPMSFFFVTSGFSPNAVSILQMALFFLSSSFLFIPAYWAMIVFAVIWQFSAGVLDRCDGEVARIRNYESEAGGRFDRLIDDLRFSLPLGVLTVACYLEYQYDTTYLIAGIVTFVYSSTATFLHNRFLRRTGYVSIQTMGKDFLKTHDSGILKLFRKVQPFVKGDIRTFYVFGAAFFGNKDVIFWMLVSYAWLLGITYFFTIKNFRPVSEKT